MQGMTFFSLDFQCVSEKTGGKWMRHLELLLSLMNNVKGLNSSLTLLKGGRQLLKFDSLFSLFNVNITECSNVSLFQGV